MFRYEHGIWWCAWVIFLRWIRNCSLTAHLRWICWTDIVWQKHKRSTFHSIFLYSNMYVENYMLYLPHISHSVSIIGIVKSFCACRTVVLNALQLEAFLQMHLIPRQSMLTRSSRRSWQWAWHRYRHSPVCSTVSWYAAETHTHVHTNFITTISATWRAVRTQTDRHIQTEIMN